MNFNDDLLLSVHKVRHGDSQYCFPLRMMLGKNGLYPNHHLKDKIFIKKENGEKFIVEDVYVHWYKGWYYIALAVNSNNSHVFISWDINSGIEENICNFTIQ